MAFKEGDLVWLHICKERFPLVRHGKLKPRTTGPLKVFKKIGDNAYKLKPLDDYNVSGIFNVVDLSSYFEDEEANELKNLFQLGEKMMMTNPSH